MMKKFFALATVASGVMLKGVNLDIEDQALKAAGQGILSCPKYKYERYWNLFCSGSMAEDDNMGAPALKSDLLQELIESKQAFKKEGNKEEGMKKTVDDLLSDFRACDQFLGCKYKSQHPTFVWTPTVAR